jgi:hypothetical protein
MSHEESIAIWIALGKFAELGDDRFLPLGIHDTKGNTQVAVIRWIVQTKRVCFIV